MTVAAAVAFSAFSLVFIWNQCRCQGLRRDVPILVEICNYKVKNGRILRGKIK